ncbi:WbuC family cupin fold metalloprotein [Bradyrhizobium neotropicale]|uniref:WbuC family cupin fold metalloprotein n=1 Tax=Bradyrhizobium neotropicale TaxID=1497615 RepID=UPI001AD7761A|nr:WbuC family cupin fold metalloprotein [Bradyrhizobium neotropicale]MBO4223590.1 cupin fold metalloprotein, WbuC family [Bradyrhizobium neotropicale]
MAPAASRTLVLGAGMTGLSNRIHQVSPEAFYSDGGFLAADNSVVSLLKTKAKDSPRRRCRLCFHASTDASQQEMLIVMHRSSYVRPHRHVSKVETLTIIEGNCDALLFDEAGRVTQVISMSAAPGEGCFFYRMPDGIFHTLIFRSEWLVFLETTIGPFDPAMTEQATWAPPETTPDAGRAYLSKLVPPQG